MNKIIIIWLSLCMLSPAMATLQHDILKNNAATPLKEFHRWQSVAKKTITGDYLTMAVLGTVDARNQPALRTMHVPNVTEKGFVFHTKQSSDKVKQLAQNKSVSLLYLWNIGEQNYMQVRINGTATPLDDPKKNTNKEIVSYLIEPNAVIFSYLKNTPAKIDIRYIDYKLDSTQQWKIIRRSLSFKR